MSGRWLSTALLIGCASAGPSDRPAHPAPDHPPDDAPSAADLVAGLEANGSIPTLDRTNTLAGVDDGDGIRDDIELYIDGHHPKLRAPARQLAAALQSSLLVDLGDLVALGEVAVQISRAVDCLDRSTVGIQNVPDDPNVLDELQSITANTKERMLAYLAFNAALDGTLSLPLEGEVCD